MILRADRLRPSTKAAKFYRLLFSARDFESLRDVAREAGFPSTAAGTMSERLMRNFRELSQPQQAQFILALKVADGSLPLGVLRSRLRTLEYFAGDKARQAAKLYQLLFLNDAYVAGPVAPPKPEAPEEAPRKSWTLPGMTIESLRNGWKWGRRRGRKKRNAPPVALEIITEEEATRRFENKGE